MIDTALLLDHAPSALLTAAAKVERYIGRADRAYLAELDAFLADTRAAWIEAVNVARAQDVPDMAEEALGVVAVYTDLIAATRARAAHLTG